MLENARRVLVIDDEEEMRQSLRFALEAVGFQVHELRNGRHAVSKYLEIKPHLVLTDIIMPEVEGVETVLSLKKVDPDVRIIVMSGGGLNHPQTYLQVCLAAGAKTSLQKPFSVHELLTVVGQVLPVTE